MSKHGIEIEEHKPNTNIQKYDFFCISNKGESYNHKRKLTL